MEVAAFFAELAFEVGADEFAVSGRAGAVEGEAVEGLGGEVG